MRKAKRLWALFLVLAMALSVLSAAPAFASEGWDGATTAEPQQADGVYQIGTGAELAWFAAEVNRLGGTDTGPVALNAVLTDNIDLAGQPWVPIGRPENGYITDAYGGVFDGQGHTISGLYIDADAANYGLFGMVNGGTVKNLKVQGQVTAKSYVGGIVGKLQTGTIENCSFSGAVTATNKTGYAGGIVGYVNYGANTTITGCCNSADVSGSYAGGILGCDNQNKNNTAITGCYNTGTITGATRSGGIAGQQSKGSISYCYSTGESASGICGFSGATITNCYYDENTAGAGVGGGASENSGEPIPEDGSLLEKLNQGPVQFNAGEGGRPVLSWQQSSTVVAVPVESVEITGTAETGATLTSRAVGAQGAAATDPQYQWAKGAEEGGPYTALEGAVHSAFTIPDTADYAGCYLRVVVTGEEESSASATVGPVAKSAGLTGAQEAEKVAAAKAALELEPLVVKTADPLELPASLEGCTITWASSNPAVISDDGVVTLPAQGIARVTLTATITCGGSSDTKAFELEVLAREVDADAYLAAVLKAMQWNFGQLQPVYGEDTNILAKFQNLLKSKGYDRVTVTIKSTADESLISPNGKIFYPAIPENSYANGKQVQVVFNLTVGGQTVQYPQGSGNALLIPWDTSSVKATLEEAADALLSEETLRGENPGLDAFSADLQLPACANRNGGRYAFAWITWESSDEAHLAISSENRESGADSLYNPYVGKVYGDEAEHTVTLTATVTNPATNLAVKRTFTVTVLPLAAGELSQTLEKLQAILNCYTAGKLADFATGEPLDTAAVQNDIQLVIPSKVVTPQELAGLDYGPHWDYWNYTFTASSSDTSLMEVNGFRAYIYRPLGESSAADRPVTLTVKIQSKANPNLSAQKEIAVTVRHLSRAEINDALSLMDAAKTSYADGLLGNNADLYSVIDDLTPYQEIVWNQDKSGVVFIYRHAERQGNGIVVDTLPGWEEQEDWRLFCTSNRDLIANETLLLNQTPSEDTFVKINSVLTDETFGKYYTKFQDVEGYDREALAKFQQLYKQPVSAYVMAVGAGSYTESFAAMPVAYKAAAYSAKLSAFKAEVDRRISVTFTVLGLDGAVIIPQTQEDSFTRGATVFDVFKKVLGEHGIPYTARGSYISAIDGLAEREHGGGSGWMYTVGDVFVNSYMNAQELLGGEEIVVLYVRDYTLANLPFTPPKKEEQKPGVQQGESQLGSAVQRNPVLQAAAAQAGNMGLPAATGDSPAPTGNGGEPAGPTVGGDRAGDLTGQPGESGSGIDTLPSGGGEAPAQPAGGKPIAAIVGVVVAVLLIALAVFFILAKRRKTEE